MNLAYLKKKKLPDTPGVYFFKKREKGKDRILYIGKATSLRDRVRSYFNDDLIATRGRLLVDMVGQATKLDVQTTDSVLEAFLLENALIKKHLPAYNTKEKDNKSFNFVVITNEDFPRVLSIRGRNLAMAEGTDEHGKKYKYVFGPYPFGTELREALRLIRKIFPYRDTCVPFDATKAGKGGTKAINKPCFNRAIGLCPGVCTGEISKRDYARQIQHLKLFFDGKKKELMSALTREMKAYAKARKFEKAGEAKKTIHALQHVQDISLIKKQNDFRKSEGENGESAGEIENMFRVESYDIAHMSGKNTVGVMTVMQNGELDKSQYRKFIIKTVKGANDTGSLREMINRRLLHTEWPMPQVVVVDGGEAQRAVAQELFTKAFAHVGQNNPTLKLTAPIIVSVVKDDKHKAREILSGDALQGLIQKKLLTTHDVVRLNAETHRYAIAFHKKRRAGDFIK